MPLYLICFMVYLNICMFLGTGSSIFSIRYIFSSLIKGLGNKIFLSRISLNNFLKYNFSFENQGCMQCKKLFFETFLCYFIVIHTSQNGQQWFFFVPPNFDLKFIILHIKPFQNHFKNENIFSYSNFMADQSFSYSKLQWMRKKMFLIGQF